MKLLWPKSLSHSYEKPDYNIILDKNYTETVADIKKIFDIFNNVRSSKYNKIELDFSKCNKISATELNILAALGPLCSNKKIYIETGNNENIFNCISPYNKGKNKAIPFKRFDSEEAIISNLQTLKDIPDISQLPKEFYDEIWSRLYELCSNANEHGHNSIGAVCNGSCENNILNFSVFDFGERNYPKCKYSFKC